MKQSSFNLICFSIALVSGISMFLMKYHVLAKEKELETLRQQIVNNKRELHLLRADWAMLTDPQHLRKMIKETELKPLLAKQIVQPSELEERPAPLPMEKPTLQESEFDDV